MNDSPWFVRRLPELCRVTIEWQPADLPLDYRLAGWFNNLGQYIHRSKMKDEQAVIEETQVTVSRSDNPSLVTFEVLEDFDVTESVRHRLLTFAPLLFRKFPRLESITIRLLPPTQEVSP